MKNFKKFLLTLMAFMLVFAMSACGNSDNGTSGSKDNGEAFNIDLKSEKVQKMTDKRASKEALLKAKEYYMKGCSQASQEVLNQHYKDVAQKIGVDASEYQYVEKYKQQRYTWYLEGNDGPCLLFVFDDNGKFLSISASIS